MTKSNQQWLKQDHYCLFKKPGETGPGAIWVAQWYHQGPRLCLSFCHHSWPVTFLILGILPYSYNMLARAPDSSKLHPERGTWRWPKLWDSLLAFLFSGEKIFFQNQEIKLFLYLTGQNWVRWLSQGSRQRNSLGIDCWFNNRLCQN